MAITKKCDRQEVISAVYEINATDFPTTVIGTGTAVKLEVIDLPEKAIIIGGHLGIDTAFDTEGVRAYGTLTAETTYTPTADQTITIGTQVYTWKGSLTAATTAGEVLIDGAKNSYANLAAAINGGAGAGVKYGS